MLAYPAWHANKYARLLARLKQLPEIPSDDIVRKAREDLKDEIKDRRDSWTLDKATALFGGIGLSGLSYLVQLFFVP